MTTLAELTEALTKRRASKSEQIAALDAQLIEIASRRKVLEQQKAMLEVALCEITNALEGLAQIPQTPAPAAEPEPAPPKPRANVQQMVLEYVREHPAGKFDDADHDTIVIAKAIGRKPGEVARAINVLFASKKLIEDGTRLILPEAPEKKDAAE